MNNLPVRLVIYLIGAASIFVILFGIRGSANILNPILLAAVITITVLPIPSRLTKRGMPGWMALVASILMVVVVLGLVIGTVFFSITKLSTSLPTYLASASQQAVADLSATQDPETAAQVEQVSLTVEPVTRSLLARVADLLVQFGLALAIFFFMISAALSLPTPSRLGLDPDTPVIGRVTALTAQMCASI
jgi:predicted PurR-regulated permease PerM